MLYAFATMMRINLCTIILKNTPRQLDQRKAKHIALPSPCLIPVFVLGCRDFSSPTDSWVRELDIMVMPEIIPLVHLLHLQLSFRSFSWTTVPQAEVVR